MLEQTIDGMFLLAHFLVTEKVDPNEVGDRATSFYRIR